MQKEITMFEIYTFLFMSNPKDISMTFDQKRRLHQVLNKWINALLSEDFVPSDKNCKNCILYNSKTGECGKHRKVVPLDVIAKSDKCPDYVQADYIPF